MSKTVAELTARLEKFGIPVEPTIEEEVGELTSQCLNDMKKEVEGLERYGIMTSKSILALHKEFKSKVGQPVEGSMKFRGKEYPVAQILDVIRGAGLPHVPVDPSTFDMPDFKKECGNYQKDAITILIAHCRNVGQWHSNAELRRWLKKQIDQLV